MKIKDVKVGMLVKDSSFPYWGRGRVVKRMKTVVHVHFVNAGYTVYDRDHIQYLEPVEGWPKK